ncbi:MAG: SDR family NAD(P)-dependent oxidoreductase [Caldilineaceae bacterium]
MDLSLTGKVAVITGGASGMGACIGRMLAAEGVQVVLADIQVEKGQAMAAEIRTGGGDASFVEANVSVRSQVEALISGVIATHGQIDISCNVAGPGASSGQLDTTMEEYDRQLDGHLRGVFNCVQVVLPHMMERRYGKIINMGSFTAYGVLPVIPAYSAAFGGIIAYSKSVARFAAPYNINVNTVSPGNIYTPMTANWLSQPGAKENLEAQIPIGRIGEPEDVAAVYLFLASDRARHLVGVDINVSGGQLIH